MPMPRPARRHACLLAGLAVAAMGCGCTPPGAPTADPASGVSRLSEARSLAIGLIQLVPYRLDDGSWLPSDGQELEIRPNISLFEAVGGIYGGNGAHTFGVPNLKQAAPDPSLTYHILKRIGDRFQPPETKQPLGMITLFALGHDPEGYVACDGRQLPRAGNEALAKALNVTGDTITLPRLTAPLPGLRYAMLIKEQGGDEAFVGTVALIASHRVPEPWLRCDGQTLDKRSHSALSTLLGSTFGEGGASTFKLPDLRGKEPAPNLTYYLAPKGVYPGRT